MSVEGYTKAGTPRLRAPAVRIPPEAVAAARPRVLAGESVRAVAREMGVSVDGLNKALHRSGIRCNRQGNGRGEVSLVLPTDPTDLAYLAGVVDGEGCIGKKTTHRKRGNETTIWRVSVANTYEPLIDWMFSFGGAKSTWEYQNPRWKTRYDWIVVRQRDVHLLLNALLPYLRVKRERALEAIECITERLKVDERPIWEEAS